MRGRRGNDGAITRREVSDPTSATNLVGSPRIKQRNIDILEVRNIASHDRQAVNDRRRSNHGIPLRTSVRDVEARATHGHHGIDSQDAAFETRQDVVIDPGSEDRTLRWVLASDSKRAQFDLENRNGRKKEARQWNRICPFDYSYLAREASNKAISSGTRSNRR
jgi:hypothetical protein